jgi:hypothetical protein
MTSARALTLVGTLALPMLVATPASAGGCAESEWRPWDWQQDSLIAENCLSRDGHPYRACSTRVLASKD